MSAVYQPMSISKNMALTKPINIFFKPCLSKFVIFHAKNSRPDYVEITTFLDNFLLLQFILNCQYR